LDLDGPTGGYNLQLCWSTGYLAGQSAAADWNRLMSVFWAPTVHFCPVPLPIVAKFCGFLCADTGAADRIPQRIWRNLPLFFKRRHQWVGQSWLPLTEKSSACRT